jgi:hypothetical protein
MMINLPFAGQNKRSSFARNPADVLKPWRALWRAVAGDPGAPLPVSTTDAHREFPQNQKPQIRPILHHIRLFGVFHG